MEVTFTETPKPTKSSPPEKPAPSTATLPTPIEPQVVIPTKEELVERTVDVYSTMGWGEAPEGAAPKPEEVTPAQGTAPAAPPAAPAAPAAPEPEPEPEAPVIEEPELSTAELIRESADATGRAIANALKSSSAPAAPEAPAGDVQLGPDDERDLAAVRYLEQSNPKQYAGAGEAYMNYVRAHYAYIDAWKEKNPDQEFDPNSQEHQAWYSENMPAIEEKDLEQARIDMAAEAKVKEKLAPIEAEREQAKREKALEAAAPKIVEQIDRKIYSMVEAANPELAKLLKSTDGALLVRDPNALKAVDDANPIAKEILTDIVQNQLEPLLLELEKTTVAEYGYQLDPQGNAAHRAIAQFVSRKEADLAAMPPSQRVLNGKRWMSLNDYAQARNSIEGDESLSAAQKGQKFADLDRRVWTITADQVEDLMCDFYGKKAKALIQKQEDLAARRFKVAPHGGARPVPNAAPQPAAQPRSASGKPRSPALGGQADTSPTAAANVPGAKSRGDEAASVAFSR